MERLKKFTRSYVLIVIGMVALGLAVALVSCDARASGKKRAVPVREPLAFADAYQDGIVLVLWGQTYSDDELNVALHKIAKSGAKHLTLPLLGCQTDIHSSDVDGCDLGPEAPGQITPGAGLRVPDREYLKHMVRLAQAQGFSVSFLPILETKDWKWRGFFDPKDVDGWFRNYTAWIRGIARDATELGMSELVVGTEFSNLYKQNDKWRGVLNAVRADFKGPLVLTVNWGDLDHTFWDAADAIGVSAYYPLSGRDNPSQDELDAGWRKNRDDLLAASRKWNRPIHITEIGYHSTTDAARTPWAASASAKPDSALQARCFTAFTRAWENRPELVRAAIWAQSDTDADDVPSSFDVIGKPAEEILSRFFATPRSP